jgi:hypothetical protein
MDRISDIRSLIRALGGAKEVAAIVGVQPGAVYMAMHRDVIPHKWRILLLQAAKSRKIRFDGSLIGMVAA